MTVLHNRQSEICPSVAPSTIKGGKLLDMSFDDAESLLGIEEKYPEVKGLDAAGRRKWFAEKHDDIKRRAAENNLELAKLDAETARLKSQSSHLDKITEWVDSGVVIERPDGPKFRELRAAVASGDTIYISKDVWAETPALDYEKEVFRFAQVLVVEHDWAAAFANSDMGDAPIKLPYDLCAFEFQYSGHPVIAFATQIDDQVAICPIIKLGGFWTIPSFCSMLDGVDSFAVTGDISKQIRAICIALEAEIAYSEIRREPHNGQAKNSHLALRDYHVVSLVSRSRAMPAPSSSQAKKHVRLHFRRGHWRHLSDHKTWIKWMLVGDPDLGFVDKHYRL